MNRFTTARSFPRSSFLATLVAVSLSLGLSACGGGNSNEPGPASINPTSSILQGRWVSSGSEPAFTAIAVPAASGANTPVVDTLWGLAQDGSTLYKLKVNGASGVAATVTGKRYTLGSAVIETVNPGSYNLTSTAGWQLTLQSVLGASATFSRSDAMITPLRPDQANGRWSAALGSVELSWTVQSAGTANSLTGTSTSGCTYSGTSAVVASQSLYRVEFNENCAGAVQRFSGMATMSSDDNHWTVVATNADESRGVALLFARQQQQKL
jgi:hypothetical protein